MQSYYQALLWLGVSHKVFVWRLAMFAAGTAAIAVGLSAPFGFPAGLNAAILVTGAIVVADSSLRLLRELFPPKACEEHSAMLAGSLAIVGTLYAIIVGFVVVVVWGSVADAQTTVAREANSLADLERMSRGFPVQIRRQVQEAARTYAELVIHEEWTAMAQGRSSELAQASLHELWAVYTEMNPKERQVNPLYIPSVTRLNELDDNRRLRLLAASDSVPGLMWSMVYAGAAGTLLMAFGFGLGPGWRVRLIVWVLAGTVAFAIYLIAFLDGPFRGDVSVNPDAFIHVLENMQNLEM